MSLDAWQHLPKRINVLRNFGDLAQDDLSISGGRWVKKACEMGCILCGSFVGCRVWPDQGQHRNPPDLRRASYPLHSGAKCLGSCGPFLKIGISVVFE
jgi:hypothetical protein